MRAPLIALLLSLPAVVAHAEPAQEARSATSACLSAVIDSAPVEDIDGDDVIIRRGKDPVSCTVRVSNGAPVVVREAVLAALKRRDEMFSPAQSRWDPQDFASRESFCSIPGARAFMTVVSTGKPGRQPVLVATVFETAKRDERCDNDRGLQKPAPEPAKPSADDE